jgi:hypothetical protein
MGDLFLFYLILETFRRSLEQTSVPKERLKLILGYLSWLLFITELSLFSFSDKCTKLKVHLENNHLFDLVMHFRLKLRN